jgi:tripartite-type tricarboxylate transporter receptor subunit TctC
LSEPKPRAVPDDDTLLINVAEFAINPHLRKLNYDALTTFEPICHLVSSPTVMVVNSASSYRSLADLLDAARANRGALTMASVGPGSPFHIGLEKLKRAAGRSSRARSGHRVRSSRPAKAMWRPLDACMRRCKQTS